MIKELVCITCPSGCHLQAVLDEQNNVLSVSGNRCPRGEAYARSELIAPRRMLTSTVRIEGALHPLLPVATSAPVLKSRIFFGDGGNPQDPGQCAGHLREHPCGKYRRQQCRSGGNQNDGENLK